MFLNGLGTRGRLLKATALTHYSEYLQNSVLQEKMCKGSDR